jgi:hypothetical protein
VAVALAKAVDPARPLTFHEDEDFGEGDADADAAVGRCKLNSVDP